jgi:PKD repeat protein
MPGDTVSFSDLSIGSPVSWSWVFSPGTVTYLSGSTAASQYPQVSFNLSGYYTVSLTVTNTNGSDTEVKTDYIHAFIPGMWTGATSSDWNTASNWDEGAVPVGTTNVTISPTALNEPVYTGDFAVGIQCGDLTIPTGALMQITGNFTINSGKSLTFAGNGELDISGNWTNNGIFNTGTGTVTFSGAEPSLVSNNGTITDVTSYNRATLTKSLVPLTDSLPGPSGDDASMDVPVGFTFNYAGTDYTQAHLCTNGWISLNATGSSASNTRLFTADLPNVVMAPWWDDLEDDGTSRISYKTEGSEPARVFSAEWYRLLSYTTGASARLTFQVKLYESTNIIEFHYGNVNTGSHSGSETASIGIEDATGGPGHFIEATTGSTTTGVSNLKSLTDWPTVNYRFSPPPVTENFYNLNINKNSTQVSFNCSVNVAGALTIQPGANLKIQFPRSLTLIPAGD